MGQTSLAKADPFVRLGPDTVLFWECEASLCCWEVVFERCESETVLFWDGDVLLEE